MDERRQLYVAALVGAAAGYIFAEVAITGELNFLAGGVFLLVFLVVTVVFERVIGWARTLE